MSSADPQSKAHAFEHLRAARTRRRFMTQGMAAAAAVAGGGLIGGARAGAASDDGTREPAAARVSDSDILNFALNLEYLEAEFYLRAAFGRGLAAGDVTGTDTQGAVSGGRQVNFAVPAVAQYAREIAADEEAHVKFLRAALGNQAVSRPTINVGTAFTTAARAAGVIASNATFDAYASDDNFLLAAFIFEDVGVSAYRGAAPSIQNANYLSAAAGILGTEAYHAGLIRTVLYARGQSNASLITAAQKISNLRDSVMKRDTDQGIVGTGGNANIVPTDANGLVYARLTGEVLKIVYLGGAAAGFGFFPNKLNGNIA